MSENEGIKTELGFVRDAIKQELNNLEQAEQDMASFDAMHCTDDSILLIAMHTCKPEIAVHVPWGEFKRLIKPLVVQRLKDSVASVTRLIGAGR